MSANLFYFTAYLCLGGPALIGVTQFFTTSAFYLGGVPTSLRSNNIFSSTGSPSSSFSGCLFDFSYTANETFPFLQRLSGTDATNSTLVLIFVRIVSKFLRHIIDHCYRKRSLCGP